jgi:hypothetical protein
MFTKLFSFWNCLERRRQSWRFLRSSFKIKSNSHSLEKLNAESTELSAFFICLSFQKMLSSRSPRTKSFTKFDFFWIFALQTMFSIYQVNGS